MTIKPASATHRYGKVFYRVQWRKNVKKYMKVVWYYNGKLGVWCRTNDYPMVKIMEYVG